MAGHLLDEGSELADLRLTHSAGIQWAVEHEDKQLDATAGTVNVREQGCADIAMCFLEEPGHTVFDYQDGGGVHDLRSGSFTLHRQWAGRNGASHASS